MRTQAFLTFLSRNDWAGDQQVAHFFCPSRVPSAPRHRQMGFAVLYAILQVWRADNGVGWVGRRSARNETQRAWLRITPASTTPSPPAATPAPATPSRPAAGRTAPSPAL